MASLRAKLDNADLLRKVFAAVADTIEEPVNLEVDEEGFSLQAMDSSHVCLIDLALHADAFSEFSCEKNMTLGLLMKKTMDAFKCSESGDSCVMTAEEEKPETVTFKFANQFVRSEFVQKTVFDEQTPLEIPEKEYSCKLSLPSKDFNRLCRDLSVVSASISIEFTKDQVIFKAGDTGNEGTIVLKENFEFDDDKAVRVSSKETLTQHFAVRYLNLFSKFTLSKQVTISLGADCPFSLEYSLGDLGWVRFYLSPKLDA